MHNFNTNHEDLIHDVSYNFYGTRLATCSSDQTVKVFDLDESADSTNWILNDSFKAHEASVTRVVWAHPEFGQVIATCSFDRTIKIFQEVDHEPRTSGRRWKRVAVLPDSRGPVHDISFAPVHLGLKLAANGADGTLRIYEAIEPHNLYYWSLVFEKVVVPEPEGAREADASYCLSWCGSKYAPEQLVVGSLSRCYIFRKSSDDKYAQCEELPGHTGSLREVAWAPSMGRSFELVATACQDEKVRIFKLSPKSDLESSQALVSSAPDRLPQTADTVPTGDHKYDVELIGEFDDHKAQVWRVSWNVTGTVLASAGDDGRIRLWKSAYSGPFQCMSVISAENKCSDATD
ncbi:hypothetical protein CANCADRAFT_27282 [Tortispora caseinolytica NRRL Y-17796]|uniref:Anaphase-promoting complex subunit 4 WD40 domain-containing protein n=1 Tax=Tortispora caseinolytica NRRL Y-17796 TaxID=767744 RepID=A0A1E4T9W5_9ASCO|nr:hypothetical protein CANCADRAFT_27282 [Tortispora caseinolytica NRRL Y-17796]